MRTPAVLTDSEIEILRRGRSDPNIVTEYFFRPYGEKRGYKFDENFDPEGAWQKSLITMSQKNAVVSGGFATGKTTTIGMGACWMALEVHPDFKFLNVAPTALQAQWMYEYIIKMASGTPFERLIWSSPAKPYPKIELRFKVYNKLVISNLLFMSIGENASNILTFEGDWINVDEAGLIDNLDEIVTKLGSRLRGSFRGRERIGRLTIMSNPWDNPHFWYLFDLAQGDPENNLSMMVSTRHNHNVTPKQLEQMLQRIPKSEWNQFIEGSRPEGHGNYFSRPSIYACEDEQWGIQIEDFANDGDKGYVIEKSAGIGAWHFETPAFRDGYYLVVGDPGTGCAPYRNAPALLVYKLNDFPKERAEIVAAWWGDGKSSIAPWTIQLAKFMSKYRPILTAVDSTATQKNTAETINELLKKRDEDGYATIFGQKIRLPVGAKVRGMDFSGAKKPSYLIAGQFLLEAELFRWPKVFTGMRGQLSNYDPMLDRGTSSKLPQDLVAAFCMAAFYIRRLYNAEISELVKKDYQASPQAIHPGTRETIRYDGPGRSRRSVAAAPSRPTEPEINEEVIPEAAEIV